MQNIGAYGVELKQVFHELEAIHINTCNKKMFDKPSCNFGYRYSIFKGEAKGQYIITSVTFKLSKSPSINTSYGAIEEELKHMGITTPTIQAVSKAVCNIRSSKLPNPAEIGNAGSFFKNPEVSMATYNSLKQQFPTIVGHETATGVKLAAGWLIEQCGWKGKQVGQTGVHAKQALVLVNYGGATGAAVLAVAHEVQAAVKEHFGVALETEVNII
jgi:UDP-N-acetylmuramate dehydrogenase